MKSLRHLWMEPKRVKRGWLGLCVRCIVITDMDLRTNHIPYISVVLLLENGFMKGTTKGKNHPSLIAQVRKCNTRVNFLQFKMDLTVVIGDWTTAGTNFRGTYHLHTGIRKFRSRWKIYLCAPFRLGNSRRYWLFWCHAIFLLLLGFQMVWIYFVEIVFPWYKI